MVKVNATYFFLHKTIWFIVVIEWVRLDFSKKYYYYKPLQSPKNKVFGATQSVCSRSSTRKTKLEMGVEYDGL